MIFIVAPIVLCGVRSGGRLTRFIAVCDLCFFPSFSLSLLHVVVGRGLVCDLWHFLPDHTRILFVYLIKHPSWYVRQSCLAVDR